MALGQNDVNLEKLKATDAAVRQNPGLAKVMVKAKSTWCRGTMTQVTLSEWYAGGNLMTPRPRRFTIMVDEPPEGGTPQPDDVHFALPRRHEGESVSDYLRRIQERTDMIRRHRPLEP